ncbi:BlaI/MecI/CopY family transcriptional regulator [Candidatus Uabimicrobium amorphum]|uniref:MarR family transcriptional regulator n=1 Tax=Uabimicrobium amorphum TaxID=2596890 RepID=A0A5S9F2M5_UABAM|nr:BlaI/MecI/CopY family transcriptional regulator [Candidatus Uabimicrobium amorphum]BBM83825.1 MarR family transcriptional regulator [Candidatus Uabimicrobium amorphum]
MARRKSKILTEVEAEIMQILWKKGQASVQEICNELASKQAYTTVATMLRVLESKKYVSHVVDGRTYIYSPLREKEKEQNNVLKYITQRFFEGSVKSLLVHLVQGDNLSKEQLQELRDIINSKEEEK